MNIDQWIWWAIKTGSTACEGVTVIVGNENDDDGRVGEGGPENIG
jgi:hypothetical protein